MKKKRVVLGVGEAYGTSYHWREERVNPCDCCGSYYAASVLGRTRREKILKGWEHLIGKQIRLVAEVLE